MIKKLIKTMAQICNEKEKPPFDVGDYCQVKLQGLTLAAKVTSINTKEGKFNCLLENSNPHGMYDVDIEFENIPISKFVKY